ncbi:hypothetical protein K6119_12760 [Paracrocinitomix mangrovi]|uniref:hypothetical protein n=1 Tax=Paracrocinitomix mangrovi TaxID=2862509 RepID=UPI001C8EFBA1|nr:hypothetical protein [Paracrocinitomix mangrovi]UKN00601.1 hypothetical protein K6119_12760 [Paracrocinitomix mangrovi]
MRIFLCILLVTLTFTTNAQIKMTLLNGKTEEGIELKLKYKGGVNGNYSGGIFTLIKANGNKIKLAFSDVKNYYVNKWKYELKPEFAEFYSDENKEVTKPGTQVPYLKYLCYNDYILYHRSSPIKSIAQKDLPFPALPPTHPNNQLYLSPDNLKNYGVWYLFKGDKCQYKINSGSENSVLKIYFKTCEAVKNALIEKKNGAKKKISVWDLDMEEKNDSGCKCN